METCSDVKTEVCHKQYKTCRSLERSIRAFKLKQLNEDNLTPSGLTWLVVDEEQWNVYDETGRDLYERQNFRMFQVLDPLACFK
jgi:hypothetical protein